MVLCQLSPLAKKSPCRVSWHLSFDYSEGALSNFTTDFEITDLLLTCIYVLHFCFSDSSCLSSWFCVALTEVGVLY